MRAWQSLLRGTKAILRLRRKDKVAVFLKGILNCSLGILELPRS